MMNCVGLCLLVRKKKTGLVVLPFVGLTLSIGIAAGYIIASKQKQMESERLK